MTPSNINVIDDKGHSYSLRAENVITHKTSDKNIIGDPVIESFSLSYYEGGYNYSKPFIYTLDGDVYKLTQEGDVPSGYDTSSIPQTVAKDQISAGMQRITSIQVI